VPILKRKTCREGRGGSCERSPSKRGEKIGRRITLHFNTESAVNPFSLLWKTDAYLEEVDSGTEVEIEKKGGKRKEPSGGKRGKKKKKANTPGR